MAGSAAAVIMRPDSAEIDPVLRDPTDDYLVALAREGDAEAIVTGDKDLLEHRDLTPAAISARQATERLGLS